MRHSQLRLYFLKTRLFFRLSSTFFEMVIASGLTKVFLLQVFCCVGIIFSTLYFIFQNQFLETMITFYQQEVTSFQEDAKREIVFWEEMAIQTPSRDIYLNLAHLYSYLGNLEKNTFYKSQAFHLDPNASNL